MSITSKSQKRTLYKVYVENINHIRPFSSISCKIAVRTSFRWVRPLTGTSRCNLVSSSQHLPNATRRLSPRRRLRGYRKCLRHEHTTCTRMTNPRPPPEPPFTSPIDPSSPTPSVFSCRPEAATPSCSPEVPVVVVQLSVEAPEVASAMGVASEGVVDKGTESAFRLGAGVPAARASTRAMRDLRNVSMTITKRFSCHVGQSNNMPMSEEIFLSKHKKNQYFRVQP